MQFNFVADIDGAKCAALFAVTRFGRAVLVTEVLEMTFTRLVTDRAIERMVDQQKLNYTTAIGLNAF
jgi:hypothetical protein